ncbi:MAG: CpsD/CapB family tyrosine-protein kinase [Clostridiales bacterium]|nr:CpsD/CapB family tyrosine-protein kinase [Clostridiales bacterium]
MSGKGKKAENLNEKISIYSKRQLIIGENTAFFVKEEYKTIRTNILLSIPSEGCKIIGITSAEPNEGKSLNCLNLAITFAQTEAKVLVIDCDLRIPNQARLMGMEAVPGLSNVLVGMNALDEIIRKTEFSNLDAVFAGDIPPNPSELLGSANMAGVMGELSARYDYIFVDLPPVNIVTDTMVMSKYLSGIVFVVRSGISKRDSVSEALGRLEMAKANILGILLTGVTEKPRYAKKLAKK